MTGQLMALSLAGGLGFATVCCHHKDGRKCHGNGFQLSTESTLIMKQGEKQTIDVMVDRADEFDQTLRLQAAAPRGLHALVSAGRLTRSHEGRFQLTVSVDADAHLGCRTIRLAAFSEYRQVMTIPVRIIVEAE